jgi:hypothetical protein
VWRSFFKKNSAVRPESRNFYTILTILRACDHHSLTYAWLINNVMMKATYKRTTEKVTISARFFSFWPFGSRAGFGAGGTNRNLQLNTTMKQSILALAVSLCMPTFAAIAQPAANTNAAPTPATSTVAASDTNNAPGRGFGPRRGRPEFAGRFARQNGPAANAQTPESPRRLAIIDALDANRDGIIDADEIAKAVDVLKSLDANKDNKLTSSEFRGNLDRQFAQRVQQRGFRASESQSGFRGFNNWPRRNGQSGFANNAPRQNSGRAFGPGGESRRNADFGPMAGPHRNGPGGYGINSNSRREGPQAFNRQTQGFGGNREYGFNGGARHEGRQAYNNRQAQDFGGPRQGQAMTRSNRQNFGNRGPAQNGPRHGSRVEAPGYNSERAPQQNQ